MRYLKIGAISTAALALVLTAAVLGGVAPFLAALALTLILGLGWPYAVGISARYRHTVIILVSGTAAALLSWLPPDTRLTWIPALVALSMIAIFLAELIRGEGAQGRLTAVISSSAAVLAVISASGWVAMSHLLRSLGETSVLAVVVPGLFTAAIIGVAGYRLLSASPEHAPRRGVLSLAVLPVALLGPTALFAARLVGLMVI